MEFQERLLCDIRKHASDKQKRLVRDMMRDLFQKGVSSDDDEELMRELQKECRTMLDSLRQQQAVYRSEPYLPGKSTVDAGLALMNTIIAPATTDAFYTALENAQSDYSGFKETYEYLRDFFEGGQVKTFCEAHDAVELYKRNQSQITDEAVKNAADAMRKIMEMAEPYEKIRNLSALRTDFLEKYNALLEQKAAPVREYVEGCYNRIFQQLNTVRCKDHFWSAVTTERDGALHKVDTAKDLNEFVLLKSDANQTKIRWINTIDQYEAAHPPVSATPATHPAGGSAPAKVANPAPMRRRVTVSIQDVTPASWQINNSAELDAYIEKLRHALKQKLDNGDTLNVDIW